MLRTQMRSLIGNFKNRVVKSHLKLVSERKTSLGYCYRFSSAFSHTKPSDDYENVQKGKFSYFGVVFVLLSIFFWAKLFS